MPAHTVHPPKGKSRGTMIHAPGGKNHFNPNKNDYIAKFHREVSPPSMAVAEQPASSPNRKPSDRIWGSG